MPKTKVDATDIRILRAVQQHGQVSKSRLSELVNLSPTPCWIRFTRLKKAGLIRGYHADIALDRILDVTKVVVMVSLKEHQKRDFERFEAFVESIDEIVECMATGGGMDYVIRVVTRSLPDFQNVMEKLLAANLGIDRYTTYIGTRETKTSQVNIARLLMEE
ncbi:Lrp/AsnC family transcriptional regulator [Halomonas urumqiensis]|uniref:AsnC family transcriptional regulator n=1 Tax=Halomonas urumqiensis TaxID=1684789 RepID=A0A2N7UQQ3_9GAMM|nr:Lrp/AsnC family transcriptional regulator [Halomonas urumqiensis]PMR82766.1 AsnC family transcriptional regulator [Halomonas urumqiensis]PTB01915.1 Lrp/AsnC family transcriptional regulator [Halomonas urumqiensis]GHE22022.1 AsnC family transcriptional regulator [Halomonas urumqiensis]